MRFVKSVSFFMPQNIKSEQKQRNIYIFCKFLYIFCYYIKKSIYLCNETKNK